MSMAPFIRIVAQGKGRARSLTQDEATEAMTLILSGKAEPEAIGALLMVLRLRGETDAEIAGFTAALRTSVCNDLPPVDLDWPCYSAGRTRGAPLFLLAAKLVSQAGYRVMLHGSNRSRHNLRDALSQTGILSETLSYHPLDTLSPVAQSLLDLRDTFGLRSCINTVLRMWNPAAASATVQGVFHPSYRGLQARAAKALGQTNLSVIKGGGGEFERNPAKDIAVFGLRDGAHIEERASSLIDETRRLHEPDQAIDLAGFWSGDLSDEFAEATVIGTAALALWTLDAALSISAADRLAERLWQLRHAPERKIA
ncbi:glycosyl transferase family protein [Cognatishimia sp. MH4019]|uniref:glycosyl transferase family protein n=1 Tax=Cognatishimia sp. MH4019 TaxID=2854030 RepID=UPI001CD320A5|nr:glycosyl transferase family protein [Cognatishimia sp. MH4019]